MATIYSFVHVKPIKNSIAPLRENKSLAIETVFLNPLKICVGLEKVLSPVSRIHNTMTMQADIKLMEIHNVLKGVCLGTSC